MAELGQVGDERGKSHARELGGVAAHRVVRLGGDVGRHPEFRRLERLGHLVGRGEREHAGEVVLGDEREGLLDRERVPHVERDQVEDVSRFAGGSARSLGDAARSDVRDLVRECADAVRPPRFQAAGGQVRPVPEFVEGLHDLLACLGPNALEALQEAAHRLVRDAGRLGDVVDRGGLRRRGGGALRFERIRTRDHRDPLSTLRGSHVLERSRVLHCAHFRHSVHLVLDKLMLSATSLFRTDVVENIWIRRALHRRTRTAIQPHNGVRIR